VQISSWMSAGRAFHADGPEKENALLLNFVRRRGTSYRPLSVDRRRLVDLAEVGSTVSARYTGGDLPLCMECISRHRKKELKENFQFESKNLHKFSTVRCVMGLKQPCNQSSISGRNPRTDNKKQQENKRTETVAINKSTAARLLI